MDTEVIQQTVALWSSDPAKAAVRPSVRAVTDPASDAPQIAQARWFRDSIVSPPIQSLACVSVSRPRPVREARS